MNLGYSMFTSRRDHDFVVSAIDLPGPGHAAMEEGLMERTQAMGPANR
jgi:hypothetical protein